MEQSEPLARSFADSDGHGAIQEHPVSRHLGAEEPAIAEQNLSDDRKADRTRHVVSQLDEHYPTAPVYGNPNQKQRFQLVNRIWAKSWTTETCSYVISILALAGLVATLLSHQNKPLPQWPQLVTINSIISLFSLLMRACVGVVLAEGISQCKWNWYRKTKKLDHIARLDSASRGSWGSVTLLYHLRPKQIYYIAALGAVTTIMASLTGFFSQQLVQFQGCLEKDTDGLANIARTNSYSQTGGSSQPNSPVDYPPMVAAINVGILQRTGDPTSTLSSGCSSGNCTVSEAKNASFSTLAISHSCEDITARVRIINETTNNRNTPSTTTFLGLDYGDNQTFEWFREGGGEVVRSWTDSSHSSSSADIIATYFLFRPRFGSTDWKIASCSLFPTINTYEASINDAVLQEYLIESIPFQSVYSQFKDPPVFDEGYGNITSWWTYKTATDYAIRNGIRESCEGSDSPASGLVSFMKHTDKPAYVNATGHTNPSAGWEWWYYPKDCIWSIHKFSGVAIAESLKEILDDKSAIMGRRGGVSGSAHLRILFEDGNMTVSSLTERMKGLATAMTTIVRTSGGDGTLTYTPDNAEGVVWINTTCMSIRWAWITFPATMIGLTGVFLMLVAFENRGVESDRLWKSSFLAALFCEVETHKEPPVGKEDMSSVAKSTSVSLEGKSRALRLVAG